MDNIDIIVNARGAPKPKERILIAGEMIGEGKRRHVRTEFFFGWVKQGPGQNGLGSAFAGEMSLH